LIVDDLDWDGRPAPYELTLPTTYVLRDDRGIVTDADGHAAAFTAGQLRPL
jgi:hypothetical protein